MSSLYDPEEHVDDEGLQRLQSLPLVKGVILFIMTLVSGLFITDH